MTTIECSCCRRRPGRSAVSPIGASPWRLARPLNCIASVANDVPARSEPIKHHGWRPSTARFCRDPIIRPRVGWVRGV